MHKKVLKKNQHQFMANSLNKVDIEGIHLNIIKDIYHKSRVNITLNCEKLKAFPLRSGTRQECPLLSLTQNSY